MCQYVQVSTINSFRRMKLCMLLKMEECAVVSVVVFA